MTTPNRSNTLVATFLALGLLAAAGASAQSAGFRRTPVTKADVAAAGHEAVVVRAEIDPGVHAGRHTHPGDEISYVLEGEGELLVDGEPPRKLKAGEAFVVPAGKVHDARNVGSATMRLVGVYVVEKGKPLATPAK
jgi:quercetin dioxygenase-like cupin family protein